MSDLIPVNASKAREDFFKILDEVFTNNKSFLIKKAGIPMAKIIKSENKSETDIMSFASIWKGAGAKKIKAYVYEGRKDKDKIKRPLPKIA